MCFQFSFFFSFALHDVHVLLFDKLHLNQTSFYSQSVFGVRGYTVSHYDENVGSNEMERHGEN